MEVCGGVGVIRRVSKKGGILFIVLLASRWVMILLLHYGMILGAGDHL